MSGVPIRSKRKVGELLNEVRRYKEEGELIKKEVESYILHYKQMVIPELKERIRDLREQLGKRPTECVTVRLSDRRQ